MGPPGVVDGRRVTPSRAVSIAVLCALCLCAAAPVSPAAAASGPRAFPAGCPGAALRPSRTNLGAVRAAVLCLVNRERAAHGERPLVPDPKLTASAQAHTNSMASQDYFEHIGPRGETPLMRMRATGYLSSTHNSYEVGENIGWGTLWKGTPSAVVAAWMASPPHRANILDARFHDTGIGVSAHPPSRLADHQPGGIYTQDFGAVIGG
jgi:uncharacterized protein YkwD